MLETLPCAINPRCITNRDYTSANPTVAITNGGRVLDRPQSTHPGDRAGINCCNSPAFCFVSFFFVDSRPKTNTAIFPALHFYASVQGYSEVKHKCDKLYLFKSG